MNKLIFIFLIFVFYSCSNNDHKNFKNDKIFDTGSRIEINELTHEKLDNLVSLGQIWGFLKYYHPNIANGNYDWDFELFRILPDYLKVKTNIERDELLLDWINSLGDFEAQIIKNKIAEENIKQTPDLDWINKSAFSFDLMTILNRIKNAKRTNKHFYISLDPNVGNPVFENENSYSSMNFPDTGFRILALYRYWNIIQYYFPYKNLIEKDWKDILKEFLPQFIFAKSEIEYKLTLIKLIGQVHDSHAQLYGPDEIIENYFGSNYPLVGISFIDNNAIITEIFQDSLNDYSKLEVGDIITSINNQPIEGIISENLPFSPASNYTIQLRNLSTKLLRTNDDSIKIEIKRNNILYSRVLKVYPKYIYFRNQKSKRDSCFKMLSSKIAYINNGELERKYIPELWMEIKNTDGLIIDNRNYPNDFPIYDLSSYLMPQSTPFVKFTNGSLTQPGLFTFTESINTGKLNQDFYKGKIVILVNEKTQSSAEFHTMAYQISPNAIVIGSTTAGADGNVSQISLPGGVKTMISGIGVYYPDGRETQRIGIVPDIEVKPTIKGVKSGKDEVLGKAIAIINNKNGL